mmetsp:Transcript_24496/g.45287  ORF Transcript_24496/g.45287 Transcript_24496/m.45287 type:complete len:81 (-) Transcript_24496:1104-1346(-)
MCMETRCVTYVLALRITLPKKDEEGRLMFLLSHLQMVKPSISFDAVPHRLSRLNPMAAMIPAKGPWVLVIELCCFIFPLP